MCHQLHVLVVIQSYIIEPFLHLCHCLDLLITASQGCTYCEYS